MPSLFPHQIEGATFLAARSAALLADEQRVGKTAAAIRACDYVMATKILVVTTASARAQWGREFREWGFPRDVQVVFKSSERIRPEADVVVVAWSMVATLADKLLGGQTFQGAAGRPSEPNTSAAQAVNADLPFERAALSHDNSQDVETGTIWDVLILDESHAAKNPAAARTRAVFGEDGLYKSTNNVWCLSGTPYPNSPADAWPMLDALAPERLDGMDYDAFVGRYCVVKPTRIGGGRVVDVIKGGKNLDELNERVKGFWLRRTQKDVGIRPPIFSVFALTVDKLPPELREDPEAQAVLDAWETGETKSLEMHLGPIRRLTGHMKAHAVVAAATEMLEDKQIDKLVLMAWHKDVMDILWTGLAQFGVVGIDGRTGPMARGVAVKNFKKNPGPRVFVGQITAAGEAIDLSAAAELWFVESSFTPKDMSQAAMRITNHHQKRQALVRVCALAGSIDEALQAILTRKVASIRQLMEQNTQ